jgi:hypothetical protein
MIIDEKFLNLPEVFLDFDAFFNMRCCSRTYCFARIESKQKKNLLYLIYIYIFISSYYQLIFVQQVNCPFEHKSMMIKYLINKNFIQKKNNEFNK